MKINNDLCIEDQQLSILQRVEPFYFCYISGNRNRKTTLQTHHVDSTLKRRGNDSLIG